MVAASNSSGRNIWQKGWNPVVRDNAKETGTDLLFSTKFLDRETEEMNASFFFLKKEKNNNFLRVSNPFRK